MVIPIFFALMRRLRPDEDPKYLEMVHTFVRTLLKSANIDENNKKDVARWGQLVRTCNAMYCIYRLTPERWFIKGRSCLNTREIYSQFDVEQAYTSKERISSALTLLAASPDLMVPCFKVGQTRYFDLAFLKASRDQKRVRQLMFDSEYSAADLRSLAFGEMSSRGETNSAEFELWEVK